MMDHRIGAVAFLLLLGAAIYHADFILFLYIDMFIWIIGQLINVAQSIV